MVCVLWVVITGRQQVRGLPRPPGPSRLVGAELQPGPTVRRGRPASSPSPCPPPSTHALRLIQGLVQAPDGRTRTRALHRCGARSGRNGRRIRRWSTGSHWQSAGPSSPGRGAACPSGRNHGGLRRYRRRNPPPPKRPPISPKFEWKAFMRSDPLKRLAHSSSSERVAPESWTWLHPPPPPPVCCCQSPSLSPPRPVAGPTHRRGHHHQLRRARSYRLAVRLRPTSAMPSPRSLKNFPTSSAPTFAP